MGNTPPDTIPPSKHHITIEGLPRIEYRLHKDEQAKPWLERFPKWKMRLQILTRMLIVFLIVFTTFIFYGVAVSQFQIGRQSPIDLMIKKLPVNAYLITPAHMNLLDDNQIRVTLVASPTLTVPITATVTLVLENAMIIPLDDSTSKTVIKLYPGSSTILNFHIMPTEYQSFLYSLRISLPDGRFDESVKRSMSVYLIPSNSIVKVLGSLSGLLGLAAVLQKLFETTFSKKS